MKDTLDARTPQIPPSRATHLKIRITTSNNVRPKATRRNRQAGTVYLIWKKNIKNNTKYSRNLYSWLNYLFPTFPSIWLIDSYNVID